MFNLCEWSYFFLKGQGLQFSSICGIKHAAMTVDVDLSFPSVSDHPLSVFFLHLHVHTQS